VLQIESVSLFLVNTRRGLFVNVLQKWKLTGMVTVVVAGSLMHSIYPWSGETRWLGFLFPVNESVWEHLKMGYYALFLYALVAYPFLHRKVHNFWFAKLVGVFVLNVTVVLVFYTYTALIGRSIVLIDILSYVLGAMLSQQLIHRIYLEKVLFRYAGIVGIGGMLIIGLMFAWFTLHPPFKSIFRDGRNGSYGIDKLKANP